MRRGIFRNIIALTLVITMLFYAIGEEPVLASQNNLVINNANEVNDQGLSELATFSNQLNALYEDIGILIENQEYATINKEIKSLRNDLKSIEKDIKAEFKENEKTLDKLGLSEIKNRNSAYEQYFDSNFSELELVLEALDDLSKDINNLRKGSSSEFESKLEALKNLTINEEVFTPIGDTLPYDSNIAGVSAFQLGDTVINDKYISDNSIPENADKVQSLETVLNDELKTMVATMASPIEIYEFVRNNFDYEPYYGSRKGAVGTYEQNGGNDTDLSSLLIGLFREKGIPARYASSTVLLTSEAAMSLTGASTPSAAAQVLANGGIPTSTVLEGGNIAYIQIEHTFVEIYVAYEYYRGLEPNEGQKIWVPLDPSIKEYYEVEGVIDVDAIIGFDAQSFLDAVSDVDENGNIISVDKGEYSSILDNADNDLQAYITANNLEDISAEEAFGGRYIVEENLDLLPLSLPCKVVGDIERVSSIDRDESDTIGFSIRGEDPSGINFSGDYGFELSYKSVKLYNSKVTLSYEPATQEDETLIAEYGDIFKVPAYLVKMVPVLKIDGHTVGTGRPINLGYRQQFTITLKSTGQSAQVVKNDVVVGSYYNIGFDYQNITVEQVQKAYDKIQSLQTTVNEDNVYQDNGIGEILNCISLSYFAEMDSFNDLLAQKFGIVYSRQISEAITGFRTGVEYLFMAPVALSEGQLYIDVDSNRISSVSQNGSDDDEISFMFTSGILSSALEHSILEQATGMEALSTIKVFEKATEQGVPILMLSKANYSEKKGLLDLSESVIKDIEQAINNGRMVMVAAEEISVYDWTGTGYIVLNPDTGAAGYMLSGGIAGGSAAYQVHAAFFANVALAIWDMVQAVMMMITFAAATGIFAPIMMLVAMVTFAFALKDLFESINLYFAYLEGDEAAGEELRKRAILNLSIELLCFGAGEIISPIADLISKRRMIKNYGSEFVESLIKKVDDLPANQLEKILKNLDTNGIRNDLIEGFADKFGKEGLEFLNKYSSKGFTNLEFDKLAQLGDNLLDCTDEFLDVFKTAYGFQDEIIEIVNDIGETAMNAIGKYGPEAAGLITELGEDAATQMLKYGDDAFDAIKTFRKEAVDIISAYQDDAIVALKNGIEPKVISDYADALGQNGIDFLTSNAKKGLSNAEFDKLLGLGDNIYKCSDEFIEAFKNSINYQDAVIDLTNEYGDDVMTAFAKSGDDAVELISQYGEIAAEQIAEYGDDVVYAMQYYGMDALNVVSQYKDDAVNAFKKGIYPDVIKDLDDINVIPSNYERYGIVDGTTATKYKNAIENASFNKTNLESVNCFMDNAESYITQYGIDFNDFNELKVLSASELTDAEKQAIRIMRDEIPAPTSDTLMQKIISPNDTAKFMDGTYNTITGSITKAGDVKQLDNVEDIYNGLRMDYPNSPFSVTDDSVTAIRFRTRNPNDIVTAYGEAMGGTVSYDMPFTGNGFLGSTNGQIIPEYYSRSKLQLVDGAEMYEITADGLEILKAIYDAESERFISIFD